ncbi:MAG: gamma-glutamyl-gamma-aminobutyrate hydrolase family protein [Bacteroidales bacterium]|nr:gamma-glutamyl-gamma-aminobutyrate hydrolase family protein [Bacteroidales bacterium]
MILINKNYSAFVAFTACVLLSIATISPSFAQQPSQNKPKSNDKIVGIVDGCKSHKNYEDWLTEYGLAYKTVTNSAEAESCALIIFCGGPDLGIDTVRDKLDSLVYEECKNKNIPIFGICRGMQEICYLMGAELIEDLGDLNAKHQRYADGKSRYHQLLLSNGEQWRVNSRHHQAVKNVPFECSLTGKSPEGIWELLLAADGSMMLVQCHPERKEMRGTEIEKASINFIKSKLK